MARLNRFRLLLGTGLLFVGLGFANVWYFVNRDWEASFYPTSYATLHYVSNVPKIDSWTAVGDHELQLQVGWNQVAQGWSLSIDGGDPQVLAGHNPVIPLVPEDKVYHDYQLTPLPAGSGLPITVKIRSLPKDMYVEGGLTSHQYDMVYTIKSDRPVGDFEQMSVQDWVDDYSYVGREALTEVDRQIREDAGVAADDPTFVKMEKLTAYLRTRLPRESRGVPRDDMRWMDPCRLFNEMADGGDQGWCVQFGQIFAFYANRAGVPTRVVSGARSQDSHLVLYTGHTWTESYIEEQGRWAYVDLTHALIYVTDKNGSVLNSVELLNLAQHEAFDGVQSRIYKDWQWAELEESVPPGGFATVPFALCARVVRQEFTAQSIFKYRQPPNVEDVRRVGLMFKDAAFAWGNIERYLFKPPLAYSRYPTEGADTYFWRRTLFFGLVASGLLLLGVGVWRRRS